MTHSLPLTNSFVRWWKAVSLLFPGHVDSMDRPLENLATPAPYQLRPARAGEETGLAHLYADSVRGLASPAYDLEQIEAWASFPAKSTEFAARLRGEITIVAEGEDGALLGFGQLEPGDHISLLYTAPAAARRGVATAIYQRLEAAARENGATELRTEASRISRPFFECQGYRLIEPEYVERGGITFERFRMEKQLAI